MNRFLDILSYRSPSPKYIRVRETKNGRYTFERVQLFDNDGKCRNRSIKRLLTDTLGSEEEYERRRKDGLNRSAILIREDEAFEAEMAPHKKKLDDLFEEQCRQWDIEQAEKAEKRRLEQEMLYEQGKVLAEEYGRELAEGRKAAQEKEEAIQKTIEFHRTLGELY